MNQLTPIDWAKRPIEKYADFTGRAPRAEYWWYTLAIIIAAIVISIVEGIVGLGKIAGPYGPLTLLFMAGLFVPGLAVTIRRLHDTNRSGWWTLLAVPYLIAGFMMVRAMTPGAAPNFGAAGMLGIIGLVGCIILLVFMVLGGTPGDNRYGPNPYGSGAVAAE